MNKFQAFCALFTNKTISNVIQVGRRYYQADPSLVAIKDRITSRDAFSLGLPLGEEKKDFQPSLALLDILSKTSSKKVFLNKKGSWLFLCKRDVFAENIKKTTIEKGLVLVQNEVEENIGLGEIKVSKGKKMLKVVLDRGDFLRREG